MNLKGSPYEREKFVGKVPWLKISQNLGFIEAGFAKIEKSRAKIALFQPFPAVFDLFSLRNLVGPRIKALWKAQIQVYKLGLFILAKNCIINF